MLNLKVCCLRSILNPNHEIRNTKQILNSNALMFQTTRRVFEGAGSFSRKPTTKAEWMIATISGCCLRPLGIVLNEQLLPMIFFNPLARH